MRNKQMALNLVCSLIRPIEKNLEEVLVEAAMSRKIRMNMARVNIL